MVSSKEINSKNFESVEYIRNSSMMVTDADVAGYANQSCELSLMIGDLRYDYAEKWNVSRSKALSIISEKCDLDDSTYKKVIAGKCRITRKFLYQLVIGLHMSVEEANVYFEMHDGELRESCLADFICIRALEDGDTIEEFKEQYKKYVTSQNQGKKNPLISK